MKARNSDSPSEQSLNERHRGPMLKLTGLWTARFEQDGEEKTFLSGSIGPLSLLVFPNGRKRKPNDPDYLAFLAPSRRQINSERTT
jgi:hypothetical protein